MSQGDGRGGDEEVDAIYAIAHPNFLDNSQINALSADGIVMVIVSDSMFLFRILAASKSYCVCRLIQIRAGMPRAFSRALATPMDIGRFP